MAIDTQTAREKLGLTRPGQPLPGEQQAPKKMPALDKRFAAAQAEYDKRRGVVIEFGEQGRALQNKREQLGQTLAREGKLTRQQRSELARVNGQLKKLVTPITRAQAQLVKADEALRKAQHAVTQHNEKERQKRMAKAAAVAERAKAGNRKKLAKLVAAAEAKSLKAAGGFAQLPKGAKPSRGTSKDTTRASAMMYGYVTKEGRGASARWVLVVTDSYSLEVIPLTVTGESAVRKGAFLPPEALKAIDKTGAFRITKAGAVQPLKVNEVGTTRITVPPLSSGLNYDPLRVEGWAMRYEVEEVGTAFMVRDDLQFPDYTQLVSKPPAKTNSFRWAVNTGLLKQVADAIGAESGRVVVTFDLSQAGKASEGRKQTRAVIVTPYRESKEVKDAATAIVMPLRVD